MMHIEKVIELIRANQLTVLKLSEVKSCETQGDEIEKVLTVSEQQKILEELRSNTSLRTLDLSNITLCQLLFDSLISILKSNTSITDLDLQNTGLTDPQAEILLSTVEKNTCLKLTNFEIEGNPLSIKFTMSRLSPFLFKSVISCSSIVSSAIPEPKLEIPDQIRCSMTHLIMRDPVLLAASGKTYERESIEKWLHNHDTEPRSNLVITSKELYPNADLKSIIDDFLEKHPELLEKDEDVHFCEYLLTDLANAISDKDKDRVDLVLSRDRRLLVKPIPSRDNRNVLSLACESTVEILNLVVNRLGDKFRELPEVKLDNGISLFRIVATKLDEPRITISDIPESKVPGSILLGTKIIADKLGWNLSDINTQLHSAVYENNLKLVQICLILGANPSEPCKGGDFPVHVSIKSEFYKVAELLLKSRANHSAPNLFGELPLHLAAYTYILREAPQCIELIRLLISRDASPNTRNRDGDTLLHYAINWFHIYPPRASDDIRLYLIKMLIELNAQVEEKNEKGDTVLISAARTGNMWLTKCILSHRPNLEARDLNGNTSLFIALDMGNPEIAKAFMEAGANIHLANKAGETPLHVAARRGYAELALDLIRRFGADCRAENPEGKIPVKLAREYGHTKLAELMEIERRSVKAVPIIEIENRKRQQIKATRLKRLPLNVIIGKQGHPEDLDNISYNIAKYPSVKRLIVFNKIKFKHKFSENIDNEPYVLSLAWLKNRTLVVGKNSGTIKLYDMRGRGKCTGTLKGHTKGVRALLILEREVLVSASEDGTIKLWDISNGMCTGTLEGHTNTVRCLVAITSTVLASSSEDGTIKLWDIVSNKCIKTLSGHTGSVRCLIRVENGMLASGSDDNTIKLWDIKSGGCISTLTGHSSDVTSLVEMANGMLISGSDDNTIKLWTLENGMCVETLREHVTNIRGLAILQHGLLASKDVGGVLKLWNMSNCSCIKTVQDTPNTRICNPAVLNNGLLALGGGNGTVSVWECSLERIELDISFRRRLQQNIARVGASESSIFIKFSSHYNDIMSQESDLLDYKTFIETIIPDTFGNIDVNVKTGTLTFNNGTPIIMQQIQKLIRALSEPEPNPESAFLQNMMSPPQPSPSSPGSLERLI